MKNKKKLKEGNANSNRWPIETRMRAATRRSVKQYLGPHPTVNRSDALQMVTDMPCISLNQSPTMGRATSEKLATHTEMASAFAKQRAVLKALSEGQKAPRVRKIRTAR